MTALTTTKQHDYATRITETFRGGVESILATGRLLIEAKDKLKHGQFTAMIERDLPFGKRAAQMMMSICSDPRLTNAKSVALLPPSWGTLYELSQLHDDEFERGLSNGVIRPDMTRAEVKKLQVVPGHLVDQNPVSDSTPEADQDQKHVPSFSMSLPPQVDEGDINHAIEIMRETGRASTSAFQRRLRVNFPRAARIMDILEERGIIGPPNGSDSREILIDLSKKENSVKETYNGSSSLHDVVKCQIVLAGQEQCFEVEIFTSKCSSRTLSCILSALDEIRDMIGKTFN